MCAPMTTLGGHLEVLQWAREQECPYGAYGAHHTCHDALEGGNVGNPWWIKRECLSDGYDDRESMRIAKTRIPMIGVLTMGIGW